jgi:hypothetical protein
MINEDVVEKITICPGIRGPNEFDPADVRDQVSDVILKSSTD